MTDADTGRTVFSARDRHGPAVAVAGDAPAEVSRAAQDAGRGARRASRTRDTRRRVLVVKWADGLQVESSGASSRSLLPH